MKHSPLKRLTPLSSKTPLKSGGFLKRGAFVPKRPKVTPEERRARKIVKERAQGRCEGCGTTRGPLDWSHRVARSQGGLWCPSNGILLCRDQHSWAHLYPSQAIPFGWILRSHQDPATEPAWLIEYGWCLLGTDGSVTPVQRKKAA